MSGPDQRVPGEARRRGWRAAAEAKAGARDEQLRVADAEKVGGPQRGHRAKLTEALARLRENEQGGVGAQHAQQLGPVLQRREHDALRRRIEAH